MLCLVAGLLLSTSLVSAQGQAAVSIDAPAQVPPGSDFVARVTISNVTDFDACNYDVTYDSAVLQVIGSEGGVSGVTTGLIGKTVIPVDIWGFVPSGTPGKIRVIQNIPGVAGVSGPGYLAEIHFHVIGASGTSSAIALGNGCLSNKDAQEILADWIGVSGLQISAQAVAPSPLSPTAPAPSATATPGESPLTPPPPASPAPSVAGIPLIWLAVGVGGATIIAAVALILRRALRRY